MSSILTNSSAMVALQTLKGINSSLGEDANLKSRLANPLIRQKTTPPSGQFPK